MINEIYDRIKRKKLIESKDVVIVGLSGGADSVCLLLVLQEIRKKMDFILWAVHVEHGIRGEESRADAAFAKELCKERDVFFRLYEEDIPSYAKKMGLGLEEAARIRRYECYKAAVKEAGKQFPENSVKVALAHHANDNAETVLFQMARGSGLDGLCGMQYKRNFAGASLIRPLLDVSREEIEEYLHSCGQNYCVDRTNEDVDYSRNRIRHNILPELNEVNGQAVLHINQSAQLLQEVREYLNSEVDKIYQKVICPEKEELILYKNLWEENAPIIQKEVIHKAIGQMAGSKKDITAAHVEAVQMLYFSQVGRKIELPYNLAARRSYDGVTLEMQCEKEEKNGFFLEIEREQLEALFEGKELEFEVSDGRVRMRGLLFDGQMNEIHKKTYTKWLNYDKIKCGLQIRTRAAGDYLTVDNEGHTKKLKDYFVNEKIPGNERNEVLLFAEQSHIIWVVGHRISADYKVDGNTKRILEVQFFGGKYHESQED